MQYDSQNNDEYTLSGEKYMFFKCAFKKDIL